MDRLIYAFGRVGLLVGMGLYFLIPSGAQAAVPNLRLSLPETLHHIDDIIPVTIKLDSQGAVVNAVSGDFNYSTIGLEVVKVEQALQNFSLWPDLPVWNDSAGRIRFTAGRPNGLIASGATVATVYVRARSSGLWQFAVGTGAQMFRNDGQGTAVSLIGNRLDLSVVDPLVPRIPITIATQPDESKWYRDRDVIITWPLEVDNQYSFSFSADPLTTADDIPDDTNGRVTETNLEDGVYWFAIKTRGGSGLWERTTRRAIRIDRTAPSPLDIQFLPRASVGDALVAAWTVFDATSGIRDQRVFIGERLIGEYSSPLEIKNAWHGQTITVVVRDQAGNVAKTNLRIPGARPWIQWGMIAGVFVIAVCVIMVIVLHRRKKHGGMIY